MSIVLELTEREEAALKSRVEASGGDFQAFLRRSLGLEGEPPVSEWTDSALLAALSEGFPEDFWTRFRLLIARRDDETLTEAERDELIAMSDRMEERDALRLPLLGELARRRGTSVRALMSELGLSTKRRG